MMKYDCDYSKSLCPARENLLRERNELLEALKAIVGLQRDADGLLGLSPINVRRAERAIAIATLGEAQADNKKGAP